MNYSNIEYCDMLLMYGEARQNATEARRLYHQQFPQRRLPSDKTIQAVHVRIRETGCVLPKKTNSGRPRDNQPDEEQILHQIEEDPGVSTREIAKNLHASQSKVCRRISEQGLYPYHLTKIHSLNQEDYQRRVDFCQWLNGRINEDRRFLKKIMWSDEAGFSRDGTFNVHNEHFWSDENPHATKTRGHQQQFSVNVWAGILDNHLIGPVFLPKPLNGQNYLNFLRDRFDNLMDDVPLHLRNTMYFMQDGAPPHFSREVRQFLDNKFNGRWIGRGGPVPWPPRSPDLTPCDFFLWGYVKSLVYKTEIVSEEDLRAKIIAAFNSIRERPYLLGNTQDSVIRRIAACLQEEGNTFENLL